MVRPACRRVSWREGVGRPECKRVLRWVYTGSKAPRAPLTAAKRHQTGARLFTPGWNLALIQGGEENAQESRVHTSVCLWTRAEEKKMDLVISKFVGIDLVGDWKLNRHAN